MGAMLIVIASPSRDSDTRLCQAGEPVMVQAFILDATVETLDLGVLRWLARLDQFEVHTILIRPLIQGLAGKLRSLIRSDR
jgi:hypothetical protein